MAELTLEQAPDMIRDWAGPKLWFERVYLYRSRGRGAPRPDSDLDIAVEMSPGDEGDVIGQWLFERLSWQPELEELLPCAGLIGPQPS